MFFSCPHCRELVATDRQTRLPPTLCPRCGGELREDPAAASPAGADPGTRSFASFLRNGESTATRSPDPAEAATEAPDAQFDPLAPAQSPEIADAAIDDADLPAEEAAADPQPSLLAPESEPESADIIIETATDPVVATMPAAQSIPATPSFTRQAGRLATQPRNARWQWVALIALSLLLLLQVLVADRKNLAADAGWRPVVVRVCATLGCTVPAWHQPGAFTMLSRNVSPIAGSAGGLQMQATFRNDARWPQRWPVLVLSLSDADGRVVGSRAFTSREYLGATATQNELGAGQSAQVALQLHEPDPDVVAFAFDFR